MSDKLIVNESYRAGWWHPRECVNEHDESGNCLDADGYIVGWREAIEVRQVDQSASAPAAQRAPSAVVQRRAYEAHVRACEPYDDGFRLPGLAYPFGRPDGMPEHEWRVSWDVMQALTDASPSPQPVPNPKTAHGMTRLLFGWPINVDQSAPVGTLELRPHSPREQ